MKHPISFMLNGESRQVDVEPYEILLDVLREKLGVKSPKVGCEAGECGACTILMGGRTVRSCLILAVEADGAELVTVEGLAPDHMTVLQKSFIEHNAFQCGYCAPGMVLSGTELLAGNAHPTVAEVKAALSGNLCRCTGYTAIIEAVRKAAEHAPALPQQEA
jgi:carbon-monoxide dehydrogenase small subunit